MKVFVLAIASFLFIQANASYEHDYNRLSKVLCAYVEADYANSIRKRLYITNLNIQDNYDKIRCDAKGNFEGGSLLDTALHFNAQDSARFLTNNVSKEKFRLSMKD